MYQATVILNIHSEETRHHSGSCMPNDLRRATLWLYYFSLSWIHFSWVESSQIPDRRTGADAVLMHYHAKLVARMWRVLRTYA